MTAVVGGLGSVCWWFDSVVVVVLSLWCNGDGGDFGSVCGCLVVLCGVVMW